MLSHLKKVKVCEKASTKLIQRQFAILSASEAFPLSTTLSPSKTLSSPVTIQKSTLENGIKLITYDKGNSKVLFYLIL